MNQLHTVSAVPALVWKKMCYSACECIKDLDMIKVLSLHNAMIEKTDRRNDNVSVNYLEGFCEEKSRFPFRIIFVLFSGEMIFVSAPIAATYIRK